MSEYWNPPTRECYDSGQCPRNSVCARNSCICRLGYDRTVNNATHELSCIIRKCFRTLDCEGKANTACSGPNGTCICSREFELDNTQQVCTLREVQFSAWRGISYGVGISAGIICIVLLILIRRILIRKRQLIRMQKALIVQERNGPSQPSAPGHSSVRSFNVAGPSSQPHRAHIQTIAGDLAQQQQSYEGFIQALQNDARFNGSIHGTTSIRIQPRTPIIHHLEPPPAYETFEHHTEPSGSAVGVSFGTPSTPFPPNISDIRDDSLRLTSRPS